MWPEYAIIWSMSIMCALAWFGCGCRCDFDPPPCSFCTSDSDTMALTISGLSNNTCSGCTTFNATFILTRTFANACRWAKSGIQGNCNTLGQQYIMSVQAQTLSPGTNVGFVAGVQIYSYYGGTNNLEYSTQRWNSGGSADFDCTSTRTPTSYLYLEDIGCSGWATLSLTVNP